MELDEIEKLEAKQKYLAEWLQRNREAQDVAPHVQSLLETTNWEIEALSNLPEEADEIASPGLMAKFERDYDHLTTALPMMPKFNLDILFNSTAINTSGSASVYMYVSHIGDLGTPRATEYSQEYTHRYHMLQANQDRPQRVRALLEKLNSSQMIERFDRALSAYNATCEPTTDRSDFCDTESCRFAPYEPSTDRADRWR